jgi:hypothetical protein
MSRPTTTLPLDKNRKLSMPEGYNLLGGSTSTGIHYFYVIRLDEDEASQVDGDQQESDIDYPVQSILMNCSLDCGLGWKYRLEFGDDGKLRMKVPIQHLVYFNYVEHFLLGSMFQLSFEKWVPATPAND